MARSTDRTSTCGMCGRALRDADAPNARDDDPALNCGGDCWECVSLAEGRAPDEDLGVFAARQRAEFEQLLTAELGEPRRPAPPQRG